MNAKVILPFVMLTLPMTSWATLLVYEPYSYSGLSNNTSINGVASNATGTSGNYSTVGSGTALYQSSGLSFASLATTGGSVLQSVSSSGAMTDTYFAVNGSVTQQGTIYSSHLFNLTVAGTSAVSFANNKVRAALASGNSFMVAQEDGGAGIAQPGVSYFNTTGAATGSLTTGITYIAISKFTRVGQLVSSTAGVADLWILSESAYTNWLTLGGGSEANLGIYANFTASNSYAGSTINGFTSGDSLQFFIRADIGDTQSLQVDELRYATTLAEVIPMVPEGGSSVFLAGALAFLSVHRRRRGQA